MKVFWAALAFACGLAGAAFAQTPSQKPVKVVFFTADWCPNCRFLAPRLTEAMQRVDSAERIDIDITNAKTWDDSLERALDKGIVRPYNAFVGTTGFAVITASDTGETIGCVNAIFESAAIERLIRRGVERVRTLPAGQRALARDSTCPKERAPPPPA